MRRVLAAAGILGLLTIGDGFVYLVLQSRSDFAAQWFPLLYVGTNVAFLAFAIPMGRLADKIGRARVFVFGHVALLAAYFVAAMPIADIAATVLCLRLPRLLLRDHGRRARGARRAADDARDARHRHRRGPDRGGRHAVLRRGRLRLPLVRRSAARSDR